MNDTTNVLTHDAYQAMASTLDNDIESTTLPLFTEAKIYKLELGTKKCKNVIDRLWAKDEM